MWVVVVGRVPTGDWSLRTARTTTDSGSSGETTADVLGTAAHPLYKMSTVASQKLPADRIEIGSKHDLSV